jgi:hypothetical protein
MRSRNTPSLQLTLLNAYINPLSNLVDGRPDVFPGAKNRGRENVGHLIQGVE